jgi:hypothetical protein
MYHRQPTCCTENADSPLPWNGVQETDGEVSPKFVENMTREFATVVTIVAEVSKRNPHGAICAIIERKKKWLQASSQQTHGCSIKLGFANRGYSKDVKSSSGQ